MGGAENVDVDVVVVVPDDIVVVVGVAGLCRVDPVVRRLRRRPALGPGAAGPKESKSVVYFLIEFVNWQVSLKQKLLRVM